MKPAQKIKKTILLQAAENEDWIDLSPFDMETEDGVNQAFDKHYSDLQDYRNEFRYGQEQTDLESDYNRNYETKEVAAKMFDGSWIAWTYYFGGGRHGEPEEMDWISYSYEVEMIEKTVVQKFFNKVTV